MPSAPLRDAASLAPVLDVSLRLPPARVAFSPVLGPLDVLECLSSLQHIALFVTLVALFAAWRLRRRTPRTRGRRMAVEIAASTVLIGGVLACYGVMLVLDRPMAALRVEDPEIVVVDFHSHTDASHDGRAHFDTERNRAWHTAAGFDAAYVTDHYFWHESDTVHVAPGETVLLGGAELRFEGGYVLALGESARYAPLLNHAQRRLHSERFDASNPKTGPILIAVLPLARERIAPLVQAGGGTVVALELHDGDPRGLTQLHREHDGLLNLTNALGLASVSGTNLHGWGRTATAWTLVRVPGWRALAPPALGTALEGALRAHQPGTVRVVERAVFSPGSSLTALTLTMPLAAMHLVRTLQPGERASWLIWIWSGWILVRFYRTVEVRRQEVAVTKGCGPGL